MADTIAENLDVVLWSAERTVAPEWHKFGRHVVAVRPDPKEAAGAVRAIVERSSAPLVLFWDAALAAPSADLLERIARGSGDAWHAGLKLGLEGQPRDIDLVAPSWMLNRDPASNVRALSWRVSLRACLVRTRVLEALGTIDPGFESLDAAALELGYHWIRRGAVVLHQPDLVAHVKTHDLVPARIPASDSYRFIATCFGRRWAAYVLARRSVASLRVVREWRAFRGVIRRVPDASRRTGTVGRAALPLGAPPKVGVLIPTLNRYAHLEATLDQLRAQTVRPHEVVCVDQTRDADRQPDIYERFSDLNLRVMWRDEPGQCSARNHGLHEMTTGLTLLLDDDVLIPADYLERLLEARVAYEADIVNGVWSQGKDEALSVIDRHFRVSDRLATGNALARTALLREVGGFDLHYNRNYRADADLGMRLYLAGAISIITPHARQTSISAPSGGLKTFGTFDGLRRIGLFKPWPAITQVYYWHRYHTPAQIRESFILAFIASAIPRELIHQVGRGRKLWFVLRQLPVAPLRAAGAWRATRAARRLLATGPRIGLDGN